VFLSANDDIVTVGEAADLVRELVPGADIKIDSGLTEWEKREVELRGKISCKRAHEQLGWRPKYTLRQGIAEYLEMFRAYLKSAGELK
jgi:nucleoside-diphosphate-sugar epimerase